jgi:hypothetical protein
MADEPPVSTFELIEVALLAPLFEKQMIAVVGRPGLDHRVAVVSAPTLARIDAQDDRRAGEQLRVHQRKVLRLDDHPRAMPSTLLIEQLKVRVYRGLDKLRKLFRGVGTRAQKFPAPANPCIVAEIVRFLVCRDQRQYHVTPAALFANVRGKIVVVEAMGDDHDATRPRIVQPRQDQTIKPLVDQFDLLDVAGILEIERIVENNEVGAVARERAADRSSKYPAALFGGEVVYSRAILGDTRLKIFLYNGDCSRRRIW